MIYRCIESCCATLAALGGIVSLCESRELSCVTGAFANIKLKRKWEKFHIWVNFPDIDKTKNKVFPK